MPNSGNTLPEIVADAEIVAAMNMILPQINTNKVTLGMTATQVTDLTVLCNTFITQYGVANTAKASAKSAVSLKDSQKRIARNALLTWAKNWRANPAVPDSLLELLLCAPHNVQPTHNPPVTPTNLVAFSDGNGNVELRWKKGTNKANTQYVVESRASSTSDYEFVGVTTKQKFETQATPGLYIGYRITASRAGENSQPTAPVILWDNGQTGAFQVAA